MPRFSNLPVPRDACLAVERLLAVRAEEVAHQHPLLGLLHLRQVHDLRQNRGARSNFDSSWHNTIHARVAPGAELDEVLQREQFMAAARLTFSRLAADLGFENGVWSNRPPNRDVRADALDALHEDLEELDAAVNRRRGASEQPRNTESDLAALRALRARRRALSDLSVANARLLDLYLAGIALALANHAGKVVEEAELLPSGTIEAALRSAGADQRRGIEYANRIAVRATNALDFEGAWAQLDTLRERFIGEAQLRDEALGALLGTLGQAYGLMACCAQDVGLLTDAEACFRSAKEHFDGEDDRQRQEVYLLHTAIARVRLLPDDAAFRSKLGAARDATEVMVRGAASGRRDYLAAAYLKACHALGEQPKAYALCARQFSEAVPDVQAALRDRMIHGLVCLSGWLLLSGGPAPRSAAQLLTAVRDQPGLIGTIAGVFLAAADRQQGQFGDEGRREILSSLSVKERTAWEKVGLCERLLKPGGELIEVVPFNFA